ncbi:MAG: toxic anion resistance protein [Lactovum sp.]
MLEQGRELKAGTFETSLEVLTEEEKSLALNYASSLKEEEPQTIMEYGAEAQTSIASFSQTVLNKVQAQDLGEIGDSLTDLMYNLKEVDTSELFGEKENFFSKIFKKVKKSIFELTQKYQKLGAGVDKISSKLNIERQGLIEDNQMLENLYQENLGYFKSLNIYIAGAELKIQQINQELLPAVRQEAEKSTENSLSIQKLSDLETFVNRLDKRAYDLKLARQMTIQQAPQIRLIQNTNQELVDKIQTSINTAIPLWKNQVALALTLLKQKDALASQRIVSEMTNDLLTKNSEMLKTSAIETAKENERGLIDIETLKTTQNNLITTIEQTLQIQLDGRQKRQQSEQELIRMEKEIKNKLLEFSKANEKSRQVKAQ